MFVACDGVDGEDKVLLCLRWREDDVSCGGVKKEMDLMVWESCGYFEGGSVCDGGGSK